MGEIQPYQGITPYARLGNALIFALLALYAAALVAMRRRLA